MTIPSNSSGPQRAFYEALPEEILRHIHTLSGEALALRKRIDAPDEFLMNLAAGDVPSGVIFKSVGADCRATIATLKSNADTLVRTFQDSALQQALEYLEKWNDDLTEEYVQEFMANALSALMTFAIRKERDRRLQNSQEAI